MKDAETNAAISAVSGTTAPPETAETTETAETAETPGTTLAADRAAPARLPSLTGLRFVAAGMVVLSHALLLSDTTPDGHPHWDTWVAMNAVSLFFVLSGYVLTHSARATDTPAAFWRRRFVKIWPVHAVAWVGALAVIAYLDDTLAERTDRLTGNVLSLFLLQSWSRDHYQGGNAVAWSLAVEAFFYLLFPALLPLVLRLSRRGLLVLAGVAAALTWLMPFVSALTVDADTLDRTTFTGQSFWFLYALPLTRLPEFVLGMAAARLAVTGTGLPRIAVLPPAAVALAVPFFADDFLPNAFMYASASAVPLALLVTATAQLDLRGKASLLRTRPAVFLGEISFACYMCHATVLTAVHKVAVDHGWSGGWAVVAALPLVLLASWALYRLVERPCMRRFAAPARPAAVPVGAA
ncbi:acyltransferase [Streptomyces sp. B1866]|uniref:acyltransferase family protein n=1 Tax=Streptomyces sp. B1866 TaxID=3075431 RepID=UPI00288DEEAE|nr:acyltransferase [Streptomyces sp. B1866]MDT3396240.1 acyltransferase [Streptomyces sp. B1866]